MKLKLTLQRSGVQPVDLAVTADATATVGDVARYLVRADPHAASKAVRPDSQTTLGLVGQDVRALDPRGTPAECGLRPGATVTITQSGSAYRDPSIGAAAMVEILAGPDAGATFPLDRGTSIVGRERGCEVRITDRTASRQHARINVTDVVEITDLGSSNGVRVDGVAVSRMILGGERVTVGDTEFVVRLLAAAPASAAESVACIRSPRLDPVYPGEKFKGPEPPEPPRLQTWPVFTVAASLLLGLGLFLATRSLVTIAFIALTPLLFVATTLESRLEQRSNYRRLLKQFRDDIEDLVADLGAAGKREVVGRNREHPTAGECIDAVNRMSPLVWTRRPGEHAFAESRLGTGRQASRNSVEIPDASKAPRYLRKELLTAVAPFAVVEGVPIVAQPGEHGGVGVAGPRQVLLDAARALVVQAACLHSPAELVIAGVASGNSAPSWDWTKWLPHASSSHNPIAGRLLAGTGPSVATLVSELEELVVRRTAEEQSHSSSSEDVSRTIPAVLLVVEQDAPVDFSRLVGLAEHGWSQGVYVLWLATDVSQLPAACRHFVELGAGSGEHQPYGAAGFVHTSEQVVPLIADLVDAQTASTVARQLSPLVDIGARISDDSDLPAGVPLLALAGAELAAETSSVIERWTENRSVLTGPFAPHPPAHAEGNLRAVIGQDAAGKHAVDLRADGPHALVGGTTGSGKSELLQSWILALATAHSPQRLTFLLVDYKGGSAFRDCVDLPHTVGLVTDLSPHLVRRALTSLGAELRYREHVLAIHGAKDLVTLEKQGVVDAPPSLVIVVDEFAALVTEVPEFIDGVVDVAQRGRSLGLHLILATQRPAGVIKENLRANTNLRLALRMADEDDSTDVLGSKEAAYFDPAIPGRAVSKTGPERLVRFQTGYVGGWTSDEPPPPALTVEELAFGGGRVWDQPEDPTPVVDESRPTDIKRLVATVQGAHEAAELPDPRIPWLRELPSVFDLADRAQVPSPRNDTELVFGIRDDPERQAQPTVAFHPDRDGNMSVYGTGGSGKSTLLRTLAVAAGFTVKGGPCHVYGLDFGSRGLAMLESLPHVGSIVPGTDDERVSRLIGWLRDVIDERAVRYSALNAGTITDYRRLADAPDEARLLLLVDGVAAFRQAYEVAVKARWFDMFAGIIADGRPVGVHVVLSSEQRTGLPPSIASSVQRRVVLRMAAADDYSLLEAPSDVLDATSPPGRGLVDGAEVQVAVLGGTADILAQSEAVAGFAEAMRRAGVVTAAPPIRSLPDTVPLADLPAVVDGLAVIGMSGVTLGPITMPASGSFLVAGAAGSGRTTALLTIVAALRRHDPAIRLHYFGPRRSVLAKLTGWETCATSVTDISDAATALATDLDGAAPGRRVAVIVENIGEFADGLADPALTELGRVLIGEEHLFVVDGEISALSSSYGLLGYAKASRSGVSLQPGEGDGALLFRNDFPRITRSDVPAGRGFVVRQGRPELAQLALPQR